MELQPLQNGDGVNEFEENKQGESFVFVIIKSVQYLGKH